MSKPAGHGICTYAGWQKQSVKLVEMDLQNDEQVERAVVESNVFALASHQFWGIWALLQARYSPIEFDYMGYVNLRWSEYYRRKEEFLCDVDAYFGSHT